MALPRVSHGQGSVIDFYPDIRINASNDPAPGYFFLAAPSSMDTMYHAYLAMVDNQGIPVFFRRMEYPVLAFSQVPDGRLAFLSWKTDYLYFMNDLLQLTDSITTVGYDLNSHDYAVSDDGHVFLIGIDKVHRDMSKVVEGGNPNATVLESVIQEFDENKNLLYTWKTSEHFEVTDGNEESIYVDLTAGIVDYCHLNSVEVDSDTSFLISSRHMDEITKVDRRTGNIIWRLGGKHNMFTFINDPIRFSHQHSIRKLKNGHILLFDNGNYHKPPFSSAVEYALDEKNMTATLIKRFRHTPDVMSVYIGSTFRIPNGNTLVDWGNTVPSLTEYHPDGTVAVEFDFSEHSFSRQVFKYNWQPRIFVPSADTLDLGMWNGRDTLTRQIVLYNNLPDTLPLKGYVNHDPSFFLMDSLPLEIPGNGEVTLTVGFYPVQAQWGYRRDVMTLYSDDTIRWIGRQIWLYGQKEDHDPPQVTILPDSANVPLNPLISITFSEPVRRTDGRELDYAGVDSVVILRKNGPEGEKIPFRAVISTARDSIAVMPDRLLERDEIYYVSYHDVLSDYMDNRVPVKEEYFSTGQVLGKKVLREKDDITIFPNPARENIRIETDLRQPWTVRLYSLTGILLREKQVTSPATGLSLRGVSPGLCLVVITRDDGKKSVRKLMIR